MTDVSNNLTQAGIRLTRQRIAIGEVLWSGPETRHVEAGALHAGLIKEGVNIALATIYNTLRDFEHTGLIRRIAVASERVWFDTDTGNHQHFYIEAESRLFDLPNSWKPESRLPSPPSGYRITRVDTVVHLAPETTELYPPS